MRYGNLPKEKLDALEALERLARNGVVTPEEALRAARLIAGDPSLAFPLPAEQPAAAAPVP